MNKSEGGIVSLVEIKWTLAGIRKETFHVFKWDDSMWLPRPVSSGWAHHQARHVPWKSYFPVAGVSLSIQLAFRISWARASSDPFIFLSVSHFLFLYSGYTHHPSWYSWPTLEHIHCRIIIIITLKIFTWWKGLKSARNTKELHTNKGP